LAAPAVRRQLAKLGSLRDWLVPVAGMASILFSFSRRGVGIQGSRRMPGTEVKHAPLPQALCFRVALLNRIEVDPADFRQNQTGHSGGWGRRLDQVTGASLHCLFLGIRTFDMIPLNVTQRFCRFTLRHEPIATLPGPEPAMVTVGVTCHACSHSQPWLRQFGGLVRRRLWPDLLPAVQAQYVKPIASGIYENKAP